MTLRWQKDIQPLLEKGLFEEADLRFQSHIDRVPTDASSLALYGYFLHFLKEHDRSEKIFEQSLEMDPSNIICLNYYIDLLTSQSKWEAAYKIAQRAYNLDASHPWTLGSYVNILRRLKKKDEVLTMCFNALTLFATMHPSDVKDLTITLADVAWDMRDLPLAKSIFEAGLRKLPRDFQLRDSFSELYIENKQMKEASEQLTILCNEYPNNHTVHTDLGYTLREIGAIENARMHYEKALELSPNYAGAHNNLGFLFLHDIKDWKLSQKHLLLAVKNDSTFANPYRHLGDLHRVYRRDYDMAQSCYERALEIRPKYREAQIGIEITDQLRKGELKSSEDKTLLTKQIYDKEIAESNKNKKDGSEDNTAPTTWYYPDGQCVASQDKV